MSRAFTLIELVVVLGILALLTHLAVREFGRLRDDRLVSEANRQLESIQASIYAPGVSGQEPTGFLADMGRMPRAFETNSLSELWACPANARPFSIVQARAENLVVGAKSLADLSVYVPSGWRGPYLRIPFGKSRLLDPWGNEFLVRDETGLERVVESNNAAVAVAQYGAFSRVADRRVLSLIPSGGAQSRLIVSGVPLGTNSYSTISYRWYGPADGLITGSVAEVSYPTPAIFSGLTPGLRILKDSITGVARAVVVRPGDNFIQIPLP